jgi:hypothetical protein
VPWQGKGAHSRAATKERRFPPLGRLPGEGAPQGLNGVPKRSAERLFTIGAASLVPVPKIPLATHSLWCSTSPRLSVSVP